MTASAGIGPFGITNSRAPPAVRPPPTKPGSVRKTGEATPDRGVANSITLNPVGLSAIVSRCAICFELSPAMSDAPVTNTSVAPGLPSVVAGTPFGITRAIVEGTGFAIPSGATAKPTVHCRSQGLKSQCIQGLAGHEPRHRRQSTSSDPLMRVWPVTRTRGSAVRFLL